MDTIISPPFILQSYRDFSRRMESAWDDREPFIPSGRYNLNDCTIDLSYRDGYYGQVAQISVIKWFTIYN